MYCEADLRPFAKYVTKDHPLKILNGQPLVLLTYIPGGSANENGDKIPWAPWQAAACTLITSALSTATRSTTSRTPVIDAVKAGAAERPRTAQDGT